MQLDLVRMVGKIRIKGVEFQVSKRPLGRQRSCVFITTLLTFIYITVFIKYAELQPKLIDVDDESMSESNDVVPTSPGQCDKYPATLKGVMKIDKFAEPPSMAETELVNPGLKPGGWWGPSWCQPRQSVAIIVPYRNRINNLLHFLAYMHPFLQRQQRHYRIYLIEQADGEVFNRGRLFNIGTDEARKDNDWDCYIFHDVDMLPENDLNIYECGENPRHFCPATDERRYTLVHSAAVGGTLGMTKEHLKKTNGFSNMYWGWGSEDDDLSLRIQTCGYNISRPPSHVGRYKMMKHVRQQTGPDRIEYFAGWRERWPFDGINSLNTLGHKILAHKDHTLYTNITTDLGPRTEVKPKTFIQAVADVVFFILN